MKWTQKIPKPQKAIRQTEQEFFSEEMNEY